MTQTEAIDYVYEKGFRYSDEAVPMMKITDVFKLIQVIYNDFNN